MPHRSAVPVLFPRVAPPGRAAAAVGVLLGLLLVLLGAAGAAAGAAHAAPAAVTTAPPLEWGFKLSWRSYAGRPTVGDGAGIVAEPSAAGYDIGWAFRSGSYDPETRTTVLRYAGSARWRSHPAASSGMRPPAGYDGPTDIDLLDVEVVDPVVTIGPDAATISAVARSRDIKTWRIVDFGRVAVADLAADATTPTVRDGTTSWTGLGATMNEAANPVFGDSYYPAGIQVDPLAFSYTGPGGAPDFSDRFDAPGTIKLGPLGENVLLAPATTPNGAYATWAVDEAHGLAHTRLDETVDGVARTTVRAFDLRTGRVVGEPLVLGADELGTVVLNDTTSGRLYVQSSGEPGARRWLRFDRETGRYEQGRTANALPATHDGSALAWDPVNRRAFEAVRVGPDGSPPGAEDPADDVWQLRTSTLGADETWSRTDYVLPGAPSGDLNRNVYQRLGVAASDGSLILLGDAQQSTSGATPPATVPAAYRVVTYEGDDVPNVAEVPGTSTPNDFQDLPSFAVAGADGTVALVDAERSGSVRILRKDDDRGEYVGLPPVDLRFAPSEVRPGQATVDPEDGTVWVGGLKSKRIVGVDGDRLVADAVFRNRNVRIGALVAGPGHMLTMQSNDGNEGNLETHASGFQRLERLGVAPTVRASPADRTVTLGADDEAQTVTFTASATSSGELRRGWQVKEPGAVRFRDLAGEAGATLTVSATREAAGRQYRAVFANDVGRVATEPATLTVRYAPRVALAPADVTTRPGQDASFELIASGSPEPAVAWQRRVGGFWQTITSDDDNFVATDGRLVLRDANHEQTGTLVRERLRNDVATVYTPAARLTVEAPVARALTGVGLDWAGSAELQRRAPNGAPSFFSAGVSDGTEAGYAAAAGSVQVLQVGADGTERPATWATRGDHLESGGRQLVRLAGGTGSVAADGTTAVRWSGSFTVNTYGGLVPFTVTDPVLTIGADGRGTLRATLSGYASSQAQPGVRTPIAPVPDVTIATFSGGRVDPDGTSTLTPEYPGVAIDIPAGQTPQDRSANGWGAWPQTFVDFQLRTGLGSYWYSSGGIADPQKRPSPVVVRVGGGGTAPPIFEPGVSAPAPFAPAPVVAPPAPPPALGAGPARAPVGPRSARIARRGGTVKVVRRTRLVAVASVTCRTGPCRLTGSRTALVRVGRRVYAARLVRPTTVRSGRSATLRVRLSPAAVRALDRRRGTVAVSVTVRSPAGTSADSGVVRLR